MNKHNDANNLVREGKALDPSDNETLVLEVDAVNRCASLDLDRKDTGQVRTTLRNSITLLSEHPRWLGAIGYDVRAEVTCYLRKPPAFAANLGAFPRPITDVDQTAIIAWLGQQTGADFPDMKIYKAVEYVARLHMFDPVKDYLEALTWDGYSRLDNWLTTYLGAEPTDYTRLVGPKFLISGAARVLQPGCQVDHVLVLEGPQGVGKTSALRILADPYHRADPPALGTRDAKEALRGCWIVEIGELDSMNKSEMSAVKNFLSQTKDHYRLPYGHRSETRDRRVIFAATTNEAEYLRDPTGNRRFWPVECTKVDLVRLARDRDQLWAEAAVRFSRGEAWYLTTSSEQRLAAHEQGQRAQIDPWHENVADFAAAHREFAATQVLNHLGVYTDRQTQREKNRVARILQTIGYRRYQVRDGSARRYVYRRPELCDRAVSPVSPLDQVDLNAGRARVEDAVVTGDSGDDATTKRGDGHG
jgi:predicted P-loop ATPase